MTTYDAGMAVDDWPSTYGYNLFLYPWTTWLFGPFDLFVEHGHRLLGALAGMITIGLVVVVWRHDERGWLRWLAVGALVAVIAQGLLGGARVLLDERLIALVHGCTGPAFFALAAALVVVTSRGWRERGGPGANDLRPVARAAAATTGLLYLQIIFGACLRHVPVDAPLGWFRTAVWFHVATALLLAVQVAALAWRLPRGEASEPWLSRPARLLVALLGVQLLLGMSTWVLKYAFPPAFGVFSFAAGFTVPANSLVQSMIVTAHVAAGSLLLATATVTSLRAARGCVGSKSRLPFERTLLGVAL